MNAEKEKSLNNNSNNFQLESTINQNNDKNGFNIEIPKEESIKKIKKVIAVKNKNKINEKNNEEINKEPVTFEGNKLSIAFNRLNIENIMSDNFSEKYFYYPCKNEVMKLEENPKYILNFYPYSSLFYDNIYLRDESIFFIHDKTQKKKFLDETDIKKIKSDNIQLNFGVDPADLYYQILRSDTTYQNRNIQIEKLQQNLNHFHIFRSRVPNYININMENFKENELLNIRNINNNEQGNPKNESMNSTRVNSSWSNKSNNSSNIQFEGREFLLNNVMKNEENKKDSDKKFINKKRKYKK